MSKIMDMFGAKKIGEGLVLLESGKVVSYCCCAWDDSADDESTEPSTTELHPLCPIHTEAGKKALEKVNKETK